MTDTAPLLLDSPDDSLVTPEDRVAQATPPAKSKQNVVPVIFRRAWADIEPKLGAALVSGSIASALISEAAHLGYPLDPGAASLITVALSFLGGYIKHSTAKQTFEGSITN